MINTVPISKLQDVFAHTVFILRLVKLYKPKNLLFISKTLETQSFIVAGFLLFTLLTSNPFQRMIPSQNNGLGFILYEIFI